MSLTLATLAVPLAAEAQRSDNTHALGSDVIRSFMGSVCVQGMFTSR